MLYHLFLGNIPEQEADSRMTWGSRLQPLLLQAAAEDLKLEVIPNAADTYVRRGKLGCTRDATIICPDRGLGALETKCVFDYRTWMTDYGGGAFVPRHHELQLQAQCYVGSTMPFAGDLSQSEAIAASDALLAQAATRGLVRLQDAWAKLPREHQAALKAALDLRHKPAAHTAERTAQ